MNILNIFSGLVPPSSINNNVVRLFDFDNNNSNCKIKVHLENRQSRYNDFSLDILLFLNSTISNSKIILCPCGTKHHILDINEALSSIFIGSINNKYGLYIKSGTYITDLSSTKLEIVDYGSSNGLTAFSNIINIGDIQIRKANENGYFDESSITVIKTAELSPFYIYQGSDMGAVGVNYLNTKGKKCELVPVSTRIRNSSDLDSMEIILNYDNKKMQWTWFGESAYDYDGAKANVIRSGTFAQKPSSDDIYVGFKYFCTDKQTTEGATDGIEIIHKGNDVWVDALGRVIS